jgi:hypothetical protein
MDGIFFVEPQRSRIGAHKAAREDLVGQLGEISLFERFDEIRANPGLRGHLIDRQAFRLTHLPKKFTH